MSRPTGEAEGAFAKALAIFSALVKFELTEDVVAFYIEALRPVGLETARMALNKLACGAKVGRGLPSVNELVEIIQPGATKLPTDEDEACVAAERICGCLTRLGSMDVGRSANGPWKRQRDFIGELGWSVVLANGGWQKLCDTVENDQLPTLKAQWRREALGHITRSRAGRLAAPELPNGNRAEQLVLEAPPPIDGSKLPQAVQEKLMVSGKIEMNSQNERIDPRGINIDSFTKDARRSQTAFEHSKRDRESW